MKRRQEAQTVYGEVVATTNNELKEMHEEIEKLGEKVNAIREKSENATFIEAAREKYRKEAEEKEEMLHIKTDEFYHKSMNDDLVKRGKMRKCLNIKAINEAVADVAKSKKADIVLSKVVPIYNKEKYLPLALRSVQKQSLKYIYR